MNFAKRKKTVIDALFILALFAVFAVSALIVVLFGAKIYSSVVKDSNSNFSERSAYYYVAQKVRAYDVAGQISVVEIGGYPALALTEKVAGRCYTTYLYGAGQSLKEITVPDDYEFIYGNGYDILEVQEFEVYAENDHLLHIHMMDMNDEITDFYVAVNSGIGGANEK